ncbi:unnamed protein product [Schistosoma rodhaini]|uniref:Uncharacterized protein n=1 Tax=Schistosoma rodhaini TaxID=6188 RepID=A0AA85GGV6_9TREM|nr:unnamed protein product [Schistosoma rodhaini]
MEQPSEAANLTVNENFNTYMTNNEQKHENNSIQPKDIHISSTSVSVHHRRKRSHISSLSGPVHAVNHIEAPTYGEYGFPSLKDHVDIVESADEENVLLSCNPEQFLRSDSTLGEKSVDSLKLAKLDPEFRELISRYVCSEYVVHCLELAGFCTPYVVARLDDHQLQRLETFVGHACSIMKSITLREHFVGPIFANDPLKFKLPSGAACGILLAAHEIRRRYRRSQLSIEGRNSIDEDIIIVPDSCDQSFSDIGCQTDSSLSHLISSASSLPVTLADPLPSNFMENSDSTSPTSVVNLTSKTYFPDSPNPLRRSEPTVPPSDGPAVIMAAALQAAAAAVSGNGHNNITLFSSALPDENSLTTLSGLSSCNSGDNNPVLHPGPSISPVSSRNTTPVSNMPPVTITSNAIPSHPNFVISSSPVGYGNGLFENERVNLERLKQHSSASAIRLASRQFVNAYLMRGRDFDMEMELSVTPEGFKRVTGIFYCHLCREKRERTSAVRFSIARNRYPVLSNVLSHLKTHFHYRGQTLSGLQATVTQQTQNVLKPANALNESFIGEGLGQSPGPFNSSSCRTDFTVEHTTNSSNTSLLPTSISPKKFQLQMKPEPGNYAYNIEAEGIEDSSSVHQIFDSLSLSNRLNSQNTKGSSPTRGLELKVIIPSRPNTDSQCNTITS